MREMESTIGNACFEILEKIFINKVVQTGRFQRTKVLQGPRHRVGCNLVRGRFKCLPKAIMKVPGLKDVMIAEVLKVLDNECETLTSETFNSLLGENDPVALRDFSWEKVMTEWKTTVPTFFKFLRHASKVFENSSTDQTYTPKDWSLPMAMGGALLLRAHLPSVCAPMYIDSMILQQGGTKKWSIEQLNRVGVCLSHSRLQGKLKKGEKRWGHKGAKRKTKEMHTQTDDFDEKKQSSTYEEGGLMYYSSRIKIILMREPTGSAVHFFF
ncbi:uncharacterized protein LOC117827126 [Xyrichtys novacula]|uniref:Uncharacterized protein LOC117827126 n=1 Tax=Xyrichtys novacula TaxID=13765 RepID=A0AAV1GEZ3_XYRNO|nr:uncharacterized protein LOC117827126 [Xyrichtys novacula]